MIKYLVLYLTLTYAKGDKAILKNSQFGYKICSWKSRIEKEYQLKYCNDNILTHSTICVTMFEGSIKPCFKNGRLFNVSDPHRKDHYWEFNPQGYFQGEETEIENPDYRNHFLRYCKHDICLVFIKLNDYYYVHTDDKTKSETCDIVLQNLRTSGSFTYPEFMKAQCHENVKLSENDPQWIKDAIHLNHNEYLKNIIKENVHKVSMETNTNVRVGFG